MEGASFVTLSHAGKLRGCIGTLKLERPLAEDVQMQAAAAASQDYRFAPLNKAELSELEIEISILSKPEPLNYPSPEKLPGLLRPGVDGVVLVHQGHRATFLPQVWEKIADPARFLTMLCQKASLPSEAWRSGKVEILTYQVESFCDTDSS
jgi:AmmeMemoRadiSam system protein A